jgi:hypothetical protein
MENEATTKTPIPTRSGNPSSGFRLLPSVSCLLSSVFCLLPDPPILPSFPGLYESIMQNKANFRNDKTNATFFAAKVYQSKPPRPNSKKQTQSNPIAPPRRDEIRDTKTVPPRYAIRDTKYKPNQTQSQNPRAGNAGVRLSLIVQNKANL